MRTRLVVALVCFACCQANTACAQERWERPASPSQQDIATARGLYEQGLAYIEELRWEDALHVFEEAYARSGVGAALYNVAAALRALGRHEEARRAIELLLREHPELDATLRASARTLLAEAEARLATLVLEDLPRDPPPSVRLDGHVVDDAGERPLRLELDPGTHALFVTAPGMHPFEWRGSLDAGDSESVRVQLAPLESGGGFEIVLVVVGAIVGAAIAGAIIGWALWDEDEIAPMAPQVIRL